MAVIYKTELKPTKLELLTSWLPSRPWYLGSDEPALVKAGGFRLDDPEGAVGIEFIIVTDTSGDRPTTYLVPLTYRGAPLDGAEHALVGTMEHGVLGPRWAYDGCHDPVLAAQLLALVEGRVQAQAQSVSDALDRDITRSYAGDGSPLTPDLTTAVTDDQESTRLPAPQGMTFRLQRVLRPAQDDAPVAPPEAIGHVAGVWQTPDGSRERGLFAVLSA
ncbi:1,4-alpha-glucan branching protein [Streptomyces sp. BG9H]|uniref:1,4-alpha-glucan branching protein n=1 Tax=Streptomyces anatolicus TaxID=2675858 RepID=A0ABS6YJK7_9ACTN|nr:1,4-alpha-glucan branching protein [Streptomyces anatolicus]MBW5421610.1 1,4-alpha-glucan branching protein [Streptomyces anatolicus]